MTPSVGDRMNYSFSQSFMVENYDLLHPILDDEMQSIKENLTYEEKKSIYMYQEYFEYVLDNTELQLPNCFEEGLSLFNQLLEIANVDEV